MDIEAQCLGCATPVGVDRCNPLYRFTDVRVGLSWRLDHPDFFRH